MNGPCAIQTPAAPGGRRTGRPRSTWIAIVSGCSLCPHLVAARLGLWLLAGLYRAGLAAANLRYALPGSIRRAARPVISVGNLTVGGTGKTPMVATLARLLKELGHEPVIVSRGYHSAPGQANEETREMERLCPGVPVVQNPDRWQAINDFTLHNACGAAVLDDGFQHRRLARDLDLVLIDATVPFGYGHVLPRGLLREPLSALRRADMIVITRTELVDAAAVAEIKRRLATLLRPGTPVLVARNRPTGLRMADGSARGLESLRGLPVAAACGIGNPDAFRQTLAQTGANVRRFDVFPDHHAYTADELAALLATSQAAGAKMLVTTGKDYVKWRPLLETSAPASVEVAALEAAIEIVEGADELHRRLDRLWAMGEGTARSIV
jgi:tetraacyldisaccharide 4'-kinase